MNKTTIKIEGRSITIAPLDYESWESNEYKRLEAIERSAQLMADGKASAADAVILRVSSENDRMHLERCVDDWDSLKGQLTVPEVRTLLKEVKRITYAEAEEGNSSASADGLQTDAA